MANKKRNSDPNPLLARLPESEIILSREGLAEFRRLQLRSLSLESVNVTALQASA
jgi:hypothetical protein